MRPEGGYGPLLQSLLGKNFSVRLKKAVRRISWQRGRVEVDGIRARQAVITLPLGVLQSGEVLFSPGLDSKESALRQLASGPVIRVAMHFRRAFWEERWPDVAFFHSPAAPFPTLWTPLPMRAPLLTAWAGGPAAARLTGLSHEELLRQAVASMRSAFGASRGRVPLPRTAYVQDWAADPFARGGYSYVLVGGRGARRSLARPIEGTLFFAGEATDTDEAIIARARRLLIARLDMDATVPMDATAYKFDMVLRGRQSTLFENRRFVRVIFGHGGRHHLLQRDTHTFDNGRSRAHYIADVCHLSGILP